MTAKYIIHPIPLMTLARPMSEQVYRMSSWIGPIGVACDYVWYIEGPKQKIVVDCGITAAMQVKAGRTMGISHIQTLEEGLGKYGLSPKDVDVVIQTHCHYDHLTLAPAFTRARFLAQQAELDYQRSPGPLPVDPRPFSRDILKGLNWQTVQGDYEVEEGLGVIFTPGHTPGGQSVVVETAGGLAVIDSLCTTFDNWDMPPALKDYDFLVPTVHSDLMQAYQSMTRIKKMADIRVPLHELRFAWVDSVPPARTRFA